MTHEVKYPQIEVQLTGGDGNAFAIIGSIRKAIRTSVGEDGQFETVAEAEAAANEYAREAQESESYDALLQHAMRTVHVS